ncbi:MAG: DUF4956 domain-containing protein [Puniceicoccales bacterium]|jgi:hypothetical protein|nr:DUF4956 domain-containing protein [Puniceicoccales bacterium]
MLDELNIALNSTFSNGGSVSPVVVALRLLVALGCGMAIAWVYKRTRPTASISTTFPMTLVLLAILIALVTQVIGDSVARAFSLVGALSIVRFRTVVRDTQDTAFVIFAVVLGMAVGTQNLWAAVIGLGVVSLAVFWQFFRLQMRGKSGPVYRLTLRLALGLEPESLEGTPLKELLLDRELISVETNRQGLGLEYVLEARLRPGIVPAQVVARLNFIEGVGSVALCRADFEA